MCFLRTFVMTLCLGLVVSRYSFVQMATRNYNVASPKRNEVPSYMMNLYLTLSRQNSGEISNTLDTVRHVKAKRVLSNRGPLKAFYDLSSLSKNDYINRDELHVHLSHFRNANGRSTSVYNLKVKDLFSRRVICRQFIIVNSTGWYKVSLRRWTSRWIRSQGSNRGLKIVVRRNGKIVNVAEPPYKRKSALKPLPYLILYCLTKSELPSFKNFYLHPNVPGSNSAKFDSKARGHIRHTRAAANSSCNSTSVQIPVNLLPSQGTLIAPRNYTTMKCTGNCRSSSSPSSANSSTNCNPNAGACCMPSKMKQLAVMYKDASNNFILKTFPNAIVEQCSCISSSSSSSTP